MKYTDLKFKDKAEADRILCKLGSDRYEYALSNYTYNGARQNTPPLNSFIANVLDTKKTPYLLTSNEYRNTIRPSAARILLKNFPVNYDHWSKNAKTFAQTPMHRFVNNLPDLKPYLTKKSFEELSDYLTKEVAKYEKAHGTKPIQRYASY